VPPRGRQVPIHQINMDRALVPVQAPGFLIFESFVLGAFTFFVGALYVRWAVVLLKKETSRTRKIAK
jgi:hypothetical protein